MTSYANPEQLAEWLDAPEAPANAVKLLRKASILVREATMTAHYEVNSSDGLPVAQTLRSALREATCIQVEAWIDADIDPTNVQPVVSSKSLGPASKSMAGAEAVFLAHQRLASELCSDALATLRSAGLLGEEPIHG